MSGESFEGIGIGRINREKTLEALSTTVCRKDQRGAREALINFLEKQKTNHVPVIIKEVIEKRSLQVLYFCEGVDDSSFSSCLCGEFFSDININ